MTGNWLGGSVTYVGDVRIAGGPGGPWLWVTDSGTPTSPFQLEHVERQGIAFGGIAGDVPVTGDWFSRGSAYFGFVRNFGPGTAPFLWVLDMTSATSAQSGHGNGAVFPYGGAPGDIPVVGKW